jgi:hypothetical protein
MLYYYRINIIYILQNIDDIFLDLILILERCLILKRKKIVNNYREMLMYLT